MKKTIFIGIIFLSINTYSAKSISKTWEEMPRPLLAELYEDYSKIEAKL